MAFFLNASLFLIFIYHHPYVIMGNFHGSTSTTSTQQHETRVTPGQEKTYTFTESELLKNHQYHFIAFVSDNGRTMRDIFDFETVSPERVYEFLTETDYENKLYGALFLEGSSQQSLVSSLERSLRGKEMTLTRKQKDDTISILKRTKEFDVLHPNPWGLPGQFQRLIDMCIAELEK